jgi:hypothetical protein
LENDSLFSEYLEYCIGMGSLTPFDVYSFVIQAIFDKDMSLDSYLSEHNKLIILGP